MNDDELKALLKQGRQHRGQIPSEEAKKRAIALALEEFDALNDPSKKKNASFFQGIWQWLRLKGKTNPLSEENSMKRPTQPWMLGGVTAVVVAMFTFTLVDFDQQNKPELYAPKKELALGDSEAAPESIPLVLQESTIQNIESDVAAAAPAPQHEIAMEEVTVSRNRSELSSIRSFAKAAPEMKSRLGVMPTDDYAGHPVNREERDEFEAFDLNPVKKVSESPVSTFSIDVDTASYSFVRKSLDQGRLPSKDTVRIEEMINYFDYQYAGAQKKDEPFKSTINVLPSPWQEGNKLVHIGVRAFDIEPEEKPRSNLVFLLDVSGSMNAPDKLPLVKQSMNLLLSQLHPEDTIAIAVYAGAAGTVLEPTPAKEKSTILAALNRLSAGGSTAGADGIKLAYQLAEANFDKNAVNRIFLATDGDFNVGITDREDLKSFVERKRDSGVFLSVLGFGRGNYNDHLMQTLAQNGNGVAAYIDTLSEAQKVLVDEASASLFPVAKDVKIQVEFNPKTVSEYRLIGYETRALKNEDFNNDKVDAGDIGAGHTVTAIYEITPVGAESGLIDDLRYAQETKSAVGSQSEYGFLKMRYKLPEGTQSKLLETVIPAKDTLKQESAQLSQEVEFSVAVAGFAQLLKDDKYLSSWSYDDALELAQKNRGEDPFGYRAEFVQLIRKAQVADEM